MNKTKLLVFNRNRVEKKEKWIYMERENNLKGTGI